MMEVLSPYLTRGQLTKAFARRSKETHPDKNPSPTAEADFRAVHDARAVLLHALDEADLGRIAQRLAVLARPPLPLLLLRYSSWVSMTRGRLELTDV